MKPKPIRIFCIAAIALLVSAIAVSQDLPDKVRGYKVHDSVIRVRGEASLAQSGQQDAALRIGSVTIADFGLSGIAIDATASITAIDQSGRVDFLTFRDFRINDLPVEIEKFDHAFSFKRGKQTALPAPVRIYIRGTSIAIAAFREFIGSKSEWTITGRAFIFGKFKKYGFSFKRAIPCQVELRMPNPIKR